MRSAVSRRFGLPVLGAIAALASVLVVASVASAQTPAIRVGSASAGVGQEATVTLEALDMPPPGLGAWTIDVAYDPEVVSAVACTAQQGGICNSTFAASSLRVAGVSIFGLEGDSTLATITLACESVGVSALTFTIQVLADATVGGPQPMDAASVDGSITCSTDPPPRPPAAPAESLGDVDCDGLVDSRDAALILQFGGGFLDSLPCPDDADVNEDGAISSVDAALILQLEAGLLEGLPPA